MSKQEQGCCEPLSEQPLAEEQAVDLATTFKALGDPVRLRLLSMIASRDEVCVCELTPAFELSQPTISHHLSILKKAGLVVCETRGRWCFYKANKDAINQLAIALEVER